MQSFRGNSLKFFARKFKRYRRTRTLLRRTRPPKKVDDAHRCHRPFPGGIPDPHPPRERPAEDRRCPAAVRSLIPLSAHDGTAVELRRSRARATGRHAASPDDSPEPDTPPSGPRPGGAPFRRKGCQEPTDLALERLKVARSTIQGRPRLGSSDVAFRNFSLIRLISWARWSKKIAMNPSGEVISE